MRELADAARLETFMRDLGSATRESGRVYFMGGATAVLHGWRSTTIDADVWLVPDSDALLQAIARLKESLRINVELVAPGQFLPELPGWSERSSFIARCGTLDFFHLDYYTQLLSKLLRRQAKDLDDVEAMISRGLIERERAWNLFEAIQPRLFRYPSIDLQSYRGTVAARLKAPPS